MTDQFLGSGSRRTDWRRGQRPPVGFAAAAGRVHTVDHSHLAAQRQPCRQTRDERGRLD